MKWNDALFAIFAASFSYVQRKKIINERVSYKLKSIDLNLSLFNVIYFIT